MVFEVINSIMKKISSKFNLRFNIDISLDFNYKKLLSVKSLVVKLCTYLLLGGILYTPTASAGLARLWPSSLGMAKACRNLLSDNLINGSDALENFNGGWRRWFKGFPNEFWSDENRYREVNKKLYISLAENDLNQLYEVAYFNNRGNPIVKMNSRKILFIPTQTQLENYYKNAKNENSQNITNITKNKPIIATYYNGFRFEFPEPQVIVNDGHHRFFSAWRKSADVFVEIEGFSDYYQTENSWGTIKLQ
jgi:hypothetical protein